MIIPVRFHILTVLLFVQFLTAQGQSASTDDANCENQILIINQSTCQHEIYLKTFDSDVKETYAGSIDPGEERMINTQFENTFIYAVNDLNQQVAGVLSQTCESKDLAIASCFVDQAEEAELCSTAQIAFRKKNAQFSPITNSRIVASCGDQLSLHVTGADGIAVWYSPFHETVITTKDHNFIVAESIDEFQKGEYTVEWYGLKGCYIRNTFTIDVANCCALRNEMVEDTVLCQGDSLLLVPQIIDYSECSEIQTGYVDELFDEKGNVADLASFEGRPDGYGPSLFRQGTNEQTFMILKLSEEIPAQSEICFLLRIGKCEDLQSNTADFRLSAGIRPFSLDDEKDFKMENLTITYQSFCITTTQPAEYVKIEDLGNGCGIRMDAVEWKKRIFYNDFNFLWDDGSTLKTKMVKRSGNYSLQMVDCNGCSTFNEISVVFDECDNVIVDPPGPPCEESFSIPSVISENYTFCYGQSRFDGNVASNDTDIDGYKLVWDKIQNPQNGSVTFRPDGTFFYFPNQGFSGQDQFSYSVCKDGFNPCDPESLIFECTGGSVTLNVHLPQFDLGADNANVCSNDELVLTVPENFSAVWSSGLVDNVISINQSGGYTVTVTDNIGCQVTDRISVNIEPAPVVSVNKTNDLNCDFSSTILSATGGALYEWNTGHAGDKISVTNPGDYTVTVTSSQGCKSISQINVDEIIYDINTVISGSRSVCTEEEFTVLSAFGGDTYVWNTGQTGQSIKVRGTGTYAVTATNTISGCKSDNTVTISKVDIFADAGVDQVSCPGASVIIGSDHIGPDNASFEWDNGASGVLGSNSTGKISVSPTQTKTYTVTVRTNTCVMQDQVTVVVNDFNFTTSSNQTICPGTSAVISAFGADRYNWNTGSSESEITVSPEKTTTYSVIGFNANGCQTERTVTVFVEDEIESDISDDQFICPGNSIGISASGGSVYSWSNGAIGSAITVQPSSSTNYQVTITNNAGCIDVRDVNVIVEPLIAVDLGPDKVVCRNEFTEFIAPPANSYLWSTGETTQVIQVAPQNSQSYSVTITQNNCSSTDAIFVEVVECLGNISGYALTDQDEAIPDVSIFLFNTSNILVGDTRTNADGFYQFNNIPSGAYTLIQSEINGYSNFSDEDESPDDDNDVDPANNVINVFVEVDEFDEGNIFRDKRDSGVISGFSLVDINGDGLGDRVFTEARITLLNSNGVELAEASPDNQGIYRFAGLSPGEYYVQQEDVAGFGNVYDTDLITGATDPDGLNDPVDNRVFVRLELNEVDSGNDFLDIPLITKISGYVLLDTDGDGVGDEAQEDITIDLVDLGGLKLRSTETNSSGYYEFIDVEEGEYFVAENPNEEDGYISLYDRDESITDLDLDGHDNNADDIIRVILTTNEHDADNNFVNQILRVGVIAGYVLEDTNDDDIGDVGMGGIQITLFDLNNNPIQARVTSNDGRFIFNDIPAGDYYLSERDIQFYEDVSDFDTEFPDDPNDQDGANDEIRVSIEANEIDDGNIFVNRRTAGDIVETCVLLRSEDFTTGRTDFWQMGGNNAEIIENPPPGGPSPNAVDINNDNGVASSIFTIPIEFGSEVNSLKLSFFYYVRGAEPTDYFLLEISKNGGADFSQLQRWSTNIDFQNRIWTQVQIVIPKEELGNSTVIRIRSKLNSTTEHLYIDDIMLDICFDQADDGGGGTSFVNDTEESTLIDVNTKTAYKLSGAEIDNRLESNDNIEKSTRLNTRPSSIHPNPARDYLNIDLENADANNNALLTVYSLDGTLQLSQEITEKQRLQLSLESLKDEQLYIISIERNNYPREMFRFFKIN